MFFLVKYSKSLEEGSFRSRPADFLWMLLFGASILVAAAHWVNIHFLGPSLTFMMVGGCGWLLWVGLVWGGRSVCVRSCSCKSWTRCCCLWPLLSLL